MSSNASYRLPVATYRGVTSQKGDISQSLQITQTQLGLQKQTRNRQNINGRSTDEMNIKLELQPGSTASYADEPHLSVYDKIPKGMNAKEYTQWAKEWLPRMGSRKGQRQARGFAIHVPSLITIAAEDRDDKSDLAGPLVLHFNHGNPREENTEYFDLYKTYKTRRVQSAKSPKFKRYTGTTRKNKANDPKWDFLRQEEESKAVRGTKLEIPAWQTSRNTPDTNELNHFLDSMKERTYLSFCQKSVDKENPTSPRMIKSKSAEVKMERFQAKRNKLGILEPPQRVPSKKGNLRQGHSFEITRLKLNEFDSPPSPNLGEAIVPIKKGGEKTERPIFLTEGRDEDVDDKHIPKPRRKQPIVQHITRIPSSLAKEEDAEHEGGEDPEFIVSGSRLGQNDTRKKHKMQELGGEDEMLSSGPFESKQCLSANGHINVTIPDSTSPGENSPADMLEDSDSEPLVNGDHRCEENDTRVTKSREIVIKFSKDDRQKIESIRTVTSERLIIRD